jgi:diguanylate cyclase (GGDEF)-like protein/PAS domain S-box-containing protein
MHMSSPLLFDASSPGERVKLARKWAYLVSTTTYIPLSHNEIESQLLELVDRLLIAVRSESTGATIAGEVGAKMVELNCVGETSLRRSVEVLGKGLLAQPELWSMDRLAERVVSVIGALSSGYVEALRLSIFQQQEHVNRALFKAARDTQRNLSASEARFDEVFACTSSGIAITNLDGKFVRTNKALRRILDRAQAGFTEITLFDVVAEEERPRLHTAFRDLLDGKVERVEQRRTMIREGSETVRPLTTLSLLRSSDDQPSHYVAVVEDDSDLSLLQSKLNHQALHDVLTGLPNRQYFTSRLEAVLQQSDSNSGATLYQLDLDAFSVITDGLGRQVGDQLLRSVAERLKSVFADEKAMVARFEGDEFAVLVENSPTTPDVVTTVKRINEELTEPIYLNGRGMAASAGIGVVRMPTQGGDLAEVLRTANMTMHRAKRQGSRQWELFDHDRDASDREAFSLAAAMPGAWEIGELSVVYERQVLLRDGSTCGVEALLEWNHPEHGTIGHQRCVELAEVTGLILPLGNWLLRSACEEAGDLPVSVSLTPSQASDPDLIGEVLRILEDTDIHPGRLQLGLPVGALTADGGEALDNLGVLVDTGVEVVVDDFGAGGRDLACLEDVQVGAVRIARWLVERQARKLGSGGSGGIVARSLEDLVSVVHTAGAAVIVGGIETEEQANWWRQVGCDRALGTHFGDTGPLHAVS